MHTTDTVDIVLVLSGEITLELDDGVQVHLQAGDTVVQNGTRHAWRNTSAEPCTLAGAQIGAVRVTARPERASATNGGRRPASGGPSF